MNLKTWLPAINDVCDEIERMRVAILESPFDSGFSHRLHLSKIRMAELQERLFLIGKQNRIAAELIRQELAEDTRELKAEITRIFIQLSDLRQLRAERARANYLHIEELKAQREKGGEE